MRDCFRIFAPILLNRIMINNMYSVIVWISYDVYELNNSYGNRTNMVRMSYCHVYHMRKTRNVYGMLSLC